MSQSMRVIGAITMYCIGCGNIIDDNAKFCPYCGMKQEYVVVTQTEAVQAEEAEATVPIEQVEAEQEAPVPTPVLDVVPEPVTEPDPVPASMPELEPEPASPRMAGAPVPPWQASQAIPHAYESPTPAVEASASVTASVPATTQHSTPVPAKKPRKGRTTLILSILAVGLSFVFQIIGAVFSLITKADMNFTVSAAGSIGACIGIALLGGAVLIKPKAEAIIETIKQGWWAIAVSMGLLLFEIISMLIDGELQVDDGWLLRSFGVLALVIVAAFIEETTFRGLYLGGLLDAFGKDRRGIMVAIIVSSTLFGLAHVDFTDGATFTPLGIVQAVLKAVQTGMYGFFLCAMTIRTTSVVGTTVLHAVDNYLLLIPSMVLANGALETDYVTTGDDGWQNVVLYLVVIALYVPLVIKAVRLLREVNPPEHGAFHQE